MRLFSCVLMSGGTKWEEYVCSCSWVWCLMKRFYKLHSAALKLLGGGGGSPTVMLYTHMLLSLYKDGAIGKRRSYVRKRFYPLSMSPPSPLQTRSFVHSSLSAPVHYAAQVFHFSKSRSRLCCCPCTQQTNPFGFVFKFLFCFCACVFG